MSIHFFSQGMSVVDIDADEQGGVIGKVVDIDTETGLVCVKWPGTGDGVFDYRNPSDLVRV
jgi:hypothetical protein